MMSFARGGLRLVSFLVLTMVLLGPYLVALRLRVRGRRTVAEIWFRGCAALCGLDIRAGGEPVEAGGSLMVANHASYLDVVVLGVLADTTFVAKAEVAGWPLFGWLARLAGTEFISRRKTDALVQRSLISARLAEGERITLFPEGTSTDGTHVRTFKSALFDVRNPDGSLWDDLTVQPVSIGYTRRRDGMSLSLGERSGFAWYGDASFLPHLLGVFLRDGAVVEVRFHEPLRSGDFESRKALAGHCEEQVRRGLGCMLAGHGPGAGVMPGAQGRPEPDQTVFSIG